MRTPAAFSPLLLAAALALGGAGIAVAAPQEPRPAPDSLLQLLEERGLLGVPQAAVDSVRQAGQTAANAAADLVMTSMNYLGVPYKRGGNDANKGFDCSGFVRHVFDRTIGLVLPRRADQQAQAPGVTRIEPEELQPGDLVFFNTLKRAFSHVGIYVGDGKFIHSPRSGGEVRVEDMRQAYWTKRFDGARRVEALTVGIAPSPRE
jgi:cell wall-associated NlpC family hydrolase